MRVLFLSANLGGNVPPTMAIAHELCDRGIDVEVAGLDLGGSREASEPNTDNRQPTDSSPCLMGAEEG